MLNRREILQCLLANALAGSVGPAHAQAHQKTRLLFIHGRGQGAEDPKVLKNIWTASLVKGLANQGLSLPNELNISYPFYGAELDKFVTQWRNADKSGVQFKGVPIDENYLSFQSGIVEELAKNSGITEGQVQREYGQNPGEKGVQNWEWVLATARAIDHANVGITEAAIKNFLADVYLYLNKRSVQDSVNRIVAKELTKEPTVIVAHSLGSIIAYNLLVTENRNLSVPLLVTIGSPLAITAIRRSFAPLRYPTSVRRWYNAFDARDIVALRPLDSVNFPITPEVENNGSIKNWTDNHHSAIGYLDDKAVSHCILRGLT